MCAKKVRLILCILLCLLPASLFSNLYAQGKGNSPAKKIQAGFVIVTPSAVNTVGLAAFETFGEMRFGGAVQAGVLPSDMVTDAMLFVTTSSRLSRNLGVAIANPQSSDAGVTFTLRGSDGKTVATKTVTVKAMTQSAQFVTQLFAGQLPGPGDFDGTLRMVSNIPVAMMGLRFRGENFSTIPVTVLSAMSQVPVISPSVGGPGAIMLPQFADGGGWSTEIVLSNTGSAVLVARVDIFNQDGSPLTVTLNGMTNSSFQGLTIPPGGVVILAPRNHAMDDDGF